MLSGWRREIRPQEKFQTVAALAQRSASTLVNRTRNFAHLLGVGRKAAYGCVAALVGFCTLAVVLLFYLFPSPPSRIVIATAAAGTSFQQFARRYAVILARSKVLVELRETTGSQENIELLRSPAPGIDVAFVTGGVERARGGGRQVWSLGALFQSQLWIFYRAGETWERLSDLEGRRIGVGPAGSASRAAAERVLGRVGVSAATAKFFDATGLTAAEALRRGEIDAAVLISDFEAPAVQALLRDDTIKLMSIPTAEAFTRIYPQLSHVVMPKGMLRIEPPRPANDVSLLASTNRLLIRDDLHPAVVHLLLEAMVEVHGAAGVFQRAGDFPKGTDPEYAVASSAADLYKNGPTFLQRNLPLWLTPIVQRAFALLLAIGAIAIPLLTTAPKVLKWIVRERIVKLYTRLRAIEQELARAPDMDRLCELQTEVATIEQECGQLPLPVRYADMYFTFAMHVDLVRSRLSGRLEELRKRGQ